MLWRRPAAQLPGFPCTLGSCGRIRFRICRYEFMRYKQGVLYHECYGMLASPGRGQDTIRTRQDAIRTRQDAIRTRVGRG